jgi:hypothetical protein
MRKCLMVLGAVLVISAIPTARAGVIAYEGFAYPLDVNLQALNEGIGWNAGWSTGSTATDYKIRSAAALGYTDSAGASLISSGAGLHITRHQRTATRDLAQPVSAAGTYWISFLVQPTFQLDANRSSGLVLRLRQNTTNRLLIGKDVGQNYKIQVRQDPEDPESPLIWVDNPAYDPDFENYGIFFGSQRSVSDVSATANISGVFPSQFLVVKYTIGTSSNDGSIHLFINPLLGSEPSVVDADASITGLNSANMSFNNIQLSPLGSETPTGRSQGYFDEIRIGTTFQAVAIPEPAAVGLLGLSGMLLMRRARRA